MSELSATSPPVPGAAFPPGRSAALERLAAIRPERYARTRNFIDGAVTRLSPYIRHGMLDLAEVRDAVLARDLKRNDIWKFIAELGWRDYWRRIYAVLGDNVWNDIEAPKTGAGTYAATLPQDITKGTTGLVCIDSFTRDLIDGGYVHNHARMYVASYVVHHRRIRWQAGARWYLGHLLDGDPSSNNLSWQWVASTFGTGPYIFNRENLERYTASRYCSVCPLASGACPFDTDYATLRANLFKKSTEPTPKLQTNLTAAPDPPLTKEATTADALTPAAAVTPADAVTPAAAVTPAGDVTPSEVEGQPPASATQARTPTSASDAVIVWVHPDAINENGVARRAAPNAPTIAAGFDAMHARDDWSASRRAFVDASLAELRITEHAKDDAAEAIVNFAKANNVRRVITTASPDPLVRSIAAAVAKQIPVTLLDPPPFATIDKRVNLGRFSRYFKLAQASAFERTPL